MDPSHPQYFADMLKPNFLGTVFPAEEDVSMLQDDEYAHQDLVVCLSSELFSDDAFIYELLFPGR